MKTELTEADRIEISTFRDTGKTITHRGQEFAVLAPPEDEKRADSKFVLRSNRGRYFALMRNKPNPTLLFGVGLYGHFACLKGWFTDKTGELVSLG